MEEHKVNLGVSHGYSTTIREQGEDITEAGPGRCSQGSSSEPIAEQCWEFCWTTGHFAIDFAVGMELQVKQAAEAGSQKDTKEKARGDIKKNLGTSFPEQCQQYQTWGWSTVPLLEYLSLLDLTQGAGTEPLLILHSPQAAQLGWHGHPPLRPSIGAAGELLWPEMRFGR